VEMKKQLIDNEIWSEFIKWGSAFELEAERLYDEPGVPYVFQIHMYGLYYPSQYEIIGKDINKLMRQAIKDGKKNRDKIKKLSEYIDG
jgi:hypothetical protein